MTEDRLIIRSYSKAIFLIPTLIVSVLGWIFQVIFHKPLLIFELIWLCLFFFNMFVVCFDFNSSKFVFLILIGIILFVLLYIFVFPLIFNPNFFRDDFALSLGFTSHFYIIITAIISLFLLIAVLTAIFDYYIIEKNELYHRKGLFTLTERWSLINLRFSKEVVDVFEYMIFRAGTLKFYPTKTDVIILPTVLNINKKEAHLNHLLSSMKVTAD